MKEIKNPDKNNTDDILALTPMQEGMLFHYLKVPTSPEYVEQLTLEISGAIDVKIFERAWNVVVEANEMLRTVFRWEKIKYPIQIILKKNHLNPLYHDLSGLDTSKKNTLIEEIKINDRKKKFDLHYIPFRVTLCKIEPTKYQMIISNHHILYDGWSNGIILKEFFNTYEDLVQKRTPINPIKNKFKEYIKWLKSQKKNKQEKFWREYLQGVENPTELAVKKRKSKDQPGKKENKLGITHTEKYQVRLDQDKKKKIEVFARKHRITLAAFFYTGWGILLQKYNNSNDVLLGTTVSGRSAKLEGIEDIVGLFINTLPLRVKQNPAATVIDMLNQVNHTLKAREEYESTSLVDINKYSQLDNRGELFDSLVVLENYPLASRLMRMNSELTVDSYSLVEASNYNLVVEIVLLGDIDIDFVYNREYIEPGTIERMSGHFCRIMENIIKNPTQPVHEIDILSEEEKQQLLVDFNDTTVDYPRDKMIHQLFAEQVGRTPDNTALVSGNPKSRIPNLKHGAPFGQINAFGGVHLSYRELNKKSNQLAGVLIERGIKPDTIVAIMVERSLEMIIGILGILTAGSAYLPIDAGYPGERIKYLLEDSNTKILVTTRYLAKEGEKAGSLEGGKNLEIVLLDFSTLLPFFPSSLPSSHLHLSPAPATSLAYIMYTSGSTGRAKGVLVDHGNVVRLVINNNYIELTGETRILQTGAPVFDATNFEIWGTLLYGGQLVLVSNDIILNAGLLGKALAIYKITTLWLTSPLFNQLVQQNSHIFSGLKYLLVGGDVLFPQTINRVRDENKGLNIINGYGPTENTTFSTTFLVDKDFPENIPIGKPISNSTAYILDRNGCMQPVGVYGELFVGGDGVSRGYLNAPELTAQKFEQNFWDYQDYYDKKNKSFCRGFRGAVFSKRAPLVTEGKIYKTGDLARWLPDGNIEFLGRIDQQVKIRGFRVELGEIENCLKNDDRIREVVVVAKQNQKADKYLCAYIVTNEAVEISQLKIRLAAQLADYMIPAYFVCLDKLPLTPTGKIDRKVLPEPGIKSELKYIPPRNQGEKLLVEIWSHVLEIEKNKIGIDDHFFELGGHSLTAISLIARINQAFDIEVSISRLFKDPTIRGIYHYIKKADPGVHQALNPAEEKEYYPLSPSQKRLHFLQQMDLGNTAYNMPSAVIIEGDVGKGKLQGIFRNLIQRHESLRTSFEIINDQPFQKIHNQVDFEMEYYQVKVEGKRSSVNRKSLEGTRELVPWSKDPAIHNPQPATALISSFIRHFDLSQAPLLRVKLMELAHTPAAPRSYPSQEGREHKYILMVDMHHIISDGVSTSILIKEFTTMYANVRLPGLRIRYKDYAECQDTERDSESMKQQEKYWLKQFATQEERMVLNLPFDYPRPKLQGFAGDTLYFEIGMLETTALKSLALKENATLFMVLLSIYNVLLSKLCGQEDITVGIPMAARRHNDLRDIMGMFVNTLALQNFPFAHQSFMGFLKEVKKKTLKAFENQEYPFEDLVEKVEVNRDTSRNPLFDVMFVLQNTEMTEIEIPGLKLKPYEFKNRTSKFDMTLTGKEKNQKLFFSMEYCTKLFKEDTILRFITYFKNIISSIIDDCERKISGISFIPDEEKRLILNDFNDTAAEYLQDKTLNELFTEQAEQTPDYIALYGNTSAWKHEKSHITYGELNDKSGRLAHLLREKGVRPDTIVGLMMERSIEMIVGIFAILKASGAYLPIDPEYPEERINYMIADSKVRFLLSDNSSRHFNCQITIISCQLSMNEQTRSTVVSSNQRPSARSSQLAYIIYTSGSTGEPKGVMVAHTSVVNLLSALQKEYPLKETDAYLLKTSIVFDVSVTELFGWFFGTGRLVILGKNGEKDPNEILETIERSCITHINFVPSMFNTFVEISDRQNINKLSDLKYIFLAGEALLPGIVNNFRQLGAGIQLENIYGPTEGTVYSSKYPVSHWDGSADIPLGRPMHNIRLYISDKDNHLQPIGIPGELHISGVGLARGYLNQPGLTAEKFAEQVTGALTHGDKCRGETISNKKFLRGGSGGAVFSKSAPLGRRRQKIYKTGDLARWLPDGNIEFLGRIDHQVKIRGFRIELGEIEAQLLERLEIKEAVVVARENKPGEKFLCAYIVSQSKSDPHDLRHYLAGRLPDYMVPSYFIRLDKIPLTPSGKVDRKALKNPEIGVDSNYAAPVNQIQEKLVEIWSRVLGIEDQRISIDSNFFRIGGHSLNAAVVLSKIHKLLNVKLSLAELFNFSTIRGLSAIIAGAAKNKHVTIEPVEKKDYYTLSSAQMRLFILQQLEPNSINYNISQLLVLESTGESDIDISRLECAFNRLVQRHESLRTSFEIVDDQSVQRIHDQVDFKIEYYGAERKAKNEKRKTERMAPGARRCVSTIKDFIRPFDLAQSPLLRVGLMELPHTPAALRGRPSQGGRKHKHILMVDMHHIISDGVSMGIIIEDFIPLYANAQIPVLRLQYRDYSQWHNKTKDSKRIKQQEEYWLKQFDREIPVLNLPIDYPRPTIQSFAGNNLHFEIGEEDTMALKSLAIKEEVTLFMLLLSITNILFSKLSSQDHVILATPIAARRHADLQGIIGMFVNTLVLQNRPDGEKTFKQFLNEVKKRTLGAYENQEYPFEKLVEKVSGHKDTSRNPLFDVIFALQNMGVPELEIPGLKLKPYEYGNKVSKFDLAFNGVEKKGRLVYTVEYCTRLFKKETILRFIKCFKSIVSTVIEKPGQKISGISIIPDDERRRILYGFNNTKADYPEDKTIHQLFKEQVEQTPDNIAIVGPQQAKKRTYMTYTTHISYHELYEKSNQLTYLLIEKGVKPDSIVAIMMERSLEMVIGVLGILNAGGAYLPIDPGYPEDRITYMLKDSGAQILLKHNHFTPGVFNNRPKGLSSYLHLSPWVNAPATFLAYVIYTSGTTGRPKGVLVRHQGLVNMIFAYRKVFGENPGSRVSQSASPAFDAMAFEIWPCLSNGAALYIVDDESRVDPHKMKKWLIEKQITISFQPTVIAEKLLDETWPEGGAALKTLSTAGDKLTRNPNRPYPFTLYNLYGPTEDTVWTTWTEVKVKPNPGKFPSIGKPVDNHQVYIASPDMQLHPIGVPGELCIAGEGLAKGYLNQPELTADKFCLRRPGGTLFEKTAPPEPPRKNFLFEGTRGLAPLLLKGTGKNHMQSCNHAALQPYSHEAMQVSHHHPPHYPFTPSPYHPIYRTGDLALWLWDGNIQFLGRSDHQIKIRGFRIELSEIERNLLTHEDISEVVVVAKEQEHKDKYICAYFISHPSGTLAGGSALAKELRAHLSRMLPHYMIPTYFVQLQQIPITPNGKVDRKALPEPGIGNTGQKNIPPRNLVERKLVEIWSDVLGIGKDKISTAANFFEIGGHSLNAEIVRSRIHKELNVKLPLVEIFKTPTIKELSPKIQEAEKSEFSDMEPVEQKEYYELSYNQKRLWFLHSLDPTNLSYHIPGWLRFSHTVNTEALQGTLSKIFTRHESFRTGFKKIRGQPVQFVRDKAEISFQTIDISRLTENEKQQKTKEIIEQITAQPFDLQNPPLFRSILIKQEDEAFLFVYNMHHIISDGWSMGIVRQEFHRLYYQYAKGNQWDPEPVPYQYKDFAAWHNQQIRDSGLRQTALRYWKKVIETGLPVLKLPYYYTGSPEDKRGAGYRCTINQTNKEKLIQLAKDNNTTLSTLLFTLYNLLFAYLCGQKEIVTIIISAGRVHSSLDMVVGYFINPVIVKIAVDLKGDFEELLSAVNRQVLEALQHQNYPFEKILDDLKIAYPNIPASFNFISMQDIGMEIEPDSRAPHHIREKQEVKFPLGLFLTEYKNGIDINWDYQKTMFEPGTIENTAEKYLDLVVEVTESDE